MTNIIIKILTKFKKPPVDLEQNSIVITVRESQLERDKKAGNLYIQKTPTKPTHYVGYTAVMGYGGGGGGYYTN